MTTTFTKQEFYEEVSRFRGFFGSKDWWSKTITQRDACVKGLTLMYLNLVELPKEEIETVAAIFQATLTEYNRRGFLLGIET